MTCDITPPLVSIRVRLYHVVTRGKRRTHTEFWGGGGGLVVHYLSHPGGRAAPRQTALQAFSPFALPARQDFILAHPLPPLRHDGGGGEDDAEGVEAWFESKKKNKRRIFWNNV